jgi:arylsulfatase K
MHPGDSFASIAKNVWGDYTDEQIKAVRRSYWAAVAEADAIMGRILDTANATGHLANTVVVFTSDHGEMGMEHRQDLKNSMYEGASRVPLVIASFGAAAAPGSSTGLPPGLVVPNITSQIDLVPTLLDLVGATGSLPHARGSTLRPFWDGSGIPFPRDYAAIEFHSNLGNTGLFGIRSGPWKLVVWGRGDFPWFSSNYTDQLFHVVNDPHELNNVAEQYPDVVNALRATLKSEWLGSGPQEIDALAKALDVHLFRRAFGGTARNGTALRTAFELTFQGFNDSDWERVKQWEALSPS